MRRGLEAGLEVLDPGELAYVFQRDEPGGRRVVERKTALASG